MQFNSKTALKFGTFFSAHPVYYIYSSIRLNETSPFLFVTHVMALDWVCVMCLEHWLQRLGTYIRKLERVQRMSWTRHVNDLQGLSYGERLRRLDLYSIQRTLLPADLIQYWKIFHGYQTRWHVHSASPRWPPGVHQYTLPGGPSIYLWPAQFLLHVRYVVEFSTARHNAQCKILDLLEASYVVCFCLTRFHRRRDNSGRARGPLRWPGLALLAVGPVGSGEARRTARWGYRCIFWRGQTREGPRWTNCYEQGLQRK